MKNLKYTPLYRVTSCFVAIVFTLTVLVPPNQGHAQTVLNLPVPGTMVTVSPSFVQPMLKGIIVHPENPFQFDFILDNGDSDLEGEELKEESTKLIRYFLASLTMPEEDLWVNLSPYEKDRIIPDLFGQTEMGRDLLAQDYLLKQLTASLMYPEDELGAKFWDKIYEKAYEVYGTTEIPINTFNKVWILPEKAVVYENGDKALIVESKLKVMMEEDYQAINFHVGTGFKPVPTDDSPISTDLIRDIILPAIEKEVNEGKNFAQLRQIYASHILATWYKQNIKESLLNQKYSDQKKVVGIEIEDKDVKQKIYDQYIEAFKKGAYNLIKEDYDPATQQVIPRKYFSGGTSLRTVIEKTQIFDSRQRTPSSTHQISLILENTSASSPVGNSVSSSGREKVGAQLNATTFWPKDQKLVQMVLGSVGLKIKSSHQVLEIGTGSGILTKVLAESSRRISNVRFVATDDNQDAVDDAKKLLKGFNNVTVRKGHLFEPIGDEEQFDIIFWNPPWFSTTSQDKSVDVARYDPNYQKLGEFIRMAPAYLGEGGQIFLVFPRISSEVLWDLAQDQSMNIEEVAQYQTKKHIVGLYQLSVSPTSSSATSTNDEAQKQHPASSPIARSSESTMAIEVIQDLPDRDLTKISDLYQKLHISKQATWPIYPAMWASREGLINLEPDDVEISLKRADDNGYPVAYAHIYFDAYEAGRITDTSRIGKIFDDLTHMSSDSELYVAKYTLRAYQLGIITDKEEVLQAIQNIEHNEFRESYAKLLIDAMRMGIIRDSEALEPLVFKLGTFSISFLRVIIQAIEYKVIKISHELKPYYASIARQFPHSLEADQIKEMMRTIIEVKAYAAGLTQEKPIIPQLFLRSRGEFKVHLRAIFEREAFKAELISEKKYDRGKKFQKRVWSEQEYAYFLIESMEDGIISNETDIVKATDGIEFKHYTAMVLIAAIEYGMTISNALVDTVLKELEESPLPLFDAYSDLLSAVIKKGFYSPKDASKQDSLKQFTRQLTPQDPPITFMLRAEILRRELGLEKEIITRWHDEAHSLMHNIDQHLAQALREDQLIDRNDFYQNLLPALANLRAISDGITNHILDRYLTQRGYLPFLKDVFQLTVLLDSEEIFVLREFYEKTKKRFHDDSTFFLGLIGYLQGYKALGLSLSDLRKNLFADTTSKESINSQFGRRFVAKLADDLNIVVDLNQVQGQQNIAEEWDFRFLGLLVAAQSSWSEEEQELFGLLVKSKLEGHEEDLLKPSQYSAYPPESYAGQEQKKVRRVQSHNLSFLREMEERGLKLPAWLSPNQAVEPVLTQGAGSQRRPIDLIREFKKRFEVFKERYSFGEFSDEWNQVVRKIGPWGNFKGEPSPNMIEERRNLERLERFVDKLHRGYSVSEVIPPELINLERILDEIRNYSPNNAQNEKGYRIRFWNRKVGKDMFLGNCAGSCTSLGKGTSAIFEFLLDQGTQYAVIENLNGNVKGYARFFLAQGDDGQTTIYVDSIDGTPANQYKQQMIDHIKSLARAIGLSDERVENRTSGTIKSKVGGTLTENYFHHSDVSLTRTSDSVKIDLDWKPQEGWPTENRSADDEAIAGEGASSPVSRKKTHALLTRLLRSKRPFKRRDTLEHLLEKLFDRKERLELVKDPAFLHVLNQVLYKVVIKREADGSFGDRMYDAMYREETERGVVRILKKIFTTPSLSKALVKSLGFFDPSSEASVNLRFHDQKSQRYMTKAFPEIADILSHPSKAKNFVLFLSLLRKVYSEVSLPYDNKWKTVTPLEYAKEIGAYVALGKNLYITPISGSFRRHVIFRMNTGGEISEAIEIFIPGEPYYEDRRRDRHIVLENRLTVSQDMSRSVGEDAGIVKTHLMAEYPRIRKVEAYGQILEYPRYVPFRIFIYDYDEMVQGRRLADHIDTININGRYLKRIAKDRREGKIPNGQSPTAKKIVRDILTIINHFIQLGYYFGGAGGGDMHLGNFQLSRDGRVRFVGDFDAFHKKSPPDPKRNLTNFEYAARIKYQIEKVLEAIPRGGMLDYEKIVAQVRSQETNPLITSSASSPIKDKDASSPVDTAMLEDVIKSNVSTDELENVVKELLIKGLLKHPKDEKFRIETDSWEVLFFNPASKKPFDEQFQEVTSWLRKEVLNDDVPETRINKFKVILRRNKFNEDRYEIEIEKMGGITVEVGRVSDVEPWSSAKVKYKPKFQMRVIKMRDFSSGSAYMKVELMDEGEEGQGKVLGVYYLIGDLSSLGGDPSEHVNYLLFPLEGVDKSRYPKTLNEIKAAFRNLELELEESYWGIKSPYIRSSTLILTFDQLQSKLSDILKRAAKFKRTVSDLTHEQVEALKRESTREEDGTIPVEVEAEMALTGKTEAGDPGVKDDQTVRVFLGGQEFDAIDIIDILQEGPYEYDLSPYIKRDQFYAVHILATGDIFIERIINEEQTAVIKSKKQNYEIRVIKHVNTRSMGMVSTRVEVYYHGEIKAVLNQTHQLTWGAEEVAYLIVRQYLGGKTKLSSYTDGITGLIKQLEEAGERYARGAAADWEMSEELGGSWGAPSPDNVDRPDTENTDNIEKLIGEWTVSLLPPDKQNPKAISQSDGGEDPSPASSPLNKGGIDFHPDYMDIQRQGNGVNVPPPLNMQEMENIEIRGLVPFIIQITPVTNLPLLFGANEEKDQEDNLELSYMDKRRESLQEISH